MKLEEFKAGSYTRQYQYESFSPTFVNYQWTWEAPKINTLLEEATRVLGELNAFSLYVPDIDLFIRMHIVKEANTSSRIEGTRTEMAEDLTDREHVAPEKRNDWQEVQNYIKAINQSIGALETLPLSTRLLRQTHTTLMQDVRGKEKMPGEYRRSQNWIGGASLQDAVFIPPHHNEIAELMSDMEKFWHNKEIEVPYLIRIAISHYQFETIHPFLDGNGRIGRLLITLFLVSHELLNRPSLYLSDYFEKNKGAYYDALTTVRASNDMIHWIKFFLVAVIETARKGTQTLREVLALRAEIEKKLLALGRRAGNASKLLTHLYRNPVVSIKQVAAYLGVTHQTASKMISDLERLGILRKVSGIQRNCVYLFSQYYNLFLR